MLPRPTLELMFASYCSPLRTGMRFCVIGPRDELVAGAKMDEMLWQGVQRDKCPWGQLTWPVPESAGTVTLLESGRTIEDDMWVWHRDSPGWQLARQSGLSGQGTNNVSLVAATVTWHMPHSDQPLDQYAQRWGRVGEKPTEKFEVFVGTRPIRRIYFLTYPMTRPNWVPDGSYCRPYTSLEQATEMTHAVVDRCTEFLGILPPGTVQTMAFRAIDRDTRRLVYRLAPWASQWCGNTVQLGSQIGRVSHQTNYATDLPSRDLLNAISSTSLAIAAVAKAASELRRRDDPIFVDPTLDERRRTLSRLELQLGVVLAEFSKHLPNVVERVFSDPDPVDQFSTAGDTLPADQSDALQQPTAVVPG